MTEVNVDLLPEHLRGINFKPWHLNAQKDRSTGKTTLTINKDFITEMMRDKNLIHMPHFEMQRYGEHGAIAISSVTVWEEGNPDKSTTGYATMTQMPRQEGQTHFGQICVTRALKVAVMRQLKLSNHDIQLMIEFYGYGVKGATTYKVEDADEPEEPVIEEPEQDLGLGFD